MPRGTARDQGSRFCNKILGGLFAKFGIKRKVSTAYHPQTNGQAKSSNKAIKRILERIVRHSRKDWSARLDEAFWAYTTARRSETPPYITAYGKSCHPPVEGEHRALWAARARSMDFDAVGEERMLLIEGLEEIRLDRCLREF